MEQKQITLQKLYKIVQSLQQELGQIKQKMEKIEVHDWEGNETFFADENLLGESWGSKEDEEAFAYLQ